MHTCRFHWWTATALAVLLAAFLGASAAGATQCISNGGFDGGLTRWTVNPDVGSWNPLMEDGGNKFVTLHPPAWDFTGPVIWQNLNITDVAGKTFSLSLKLRTYGAGEGETVAVHIAYVDGVGNRKTQAVLQPPNSSISDWTLCSTVFPAPAGAQKIVGLIIKKEDYGEFHADDISLTADGVTVGTVPAVNSLSPASGPYGTEVNINGTGFGATQGPGSFVILGNGGAGVTVLSWSDTLVRVRVEDPCQSGVVTVFSGQVRSDGNSVFTVTSPHYRVQMLNADERVIKGQMAEFLIRADFMNGFSSATGVTFSAPSAPAGTATFFPGPLHNEGGILMRVDTSTIPAGVYTWDVVASEPTLQQRHLAVTLSVVTVTGVRFYENEGSETPITSVTATQQGKMSIYGEVEVSDGEEMEWENDTAVITSSNPAVADLYTNVWYGPELYAISSGSATLTATFPDGFTATLPITVSLPSSPLIDGLAVTPMVVDNSGTQTLNLYAHSTEPLGGVAWDIPFFGWPEGDFYEDNHAYSGTGKLQPGCNPGTYFFKTGDEWGSPYRVAPLTVVNAPDRGAIKGKMHSLDSNGPPEVFGTMELYDTGGNKVKELEIWGFQVDGGYTASYIEPGTYRLRFVPSYMQKPQWYPNAEDFDDAQNITVTAGGEVKDIFFFLREAPQEPLTLVNREPAEGAQRASTVAPIRIEFNRDVDSLTVNSETFKLSDSLDAEVPGSISGFGTSYTFTPSSPLTPGATYHAVVTTGVRDSEGTPLDQEYSWQFTTSNDSTAALRDIPDGEYVSLAGKALYLKRNGFGYIEEPSRATGIRIEGELSGSEGDLVAVTGILRTSAAEERYIELTWMGTTGLGPVKPLIANNRDLKTPLMNGLFVGAYGIVVPGSVSTQGFSITDGHDMAGIPVRTDTPPDVTDGEPVMVIGAAGWDSGRIIYASQVMK